MRTITPTGLQHKTFTAAEGAIEFRSPFNQVRKLGGVPIEHPALKDVLQRLRARGLRIPEPLHPASPSTEIVDRREDAEILARIEAKSHACGTPGCWGSSGFQSIGCLLRQRRQDCEAQMTDNFNLPLSRTIDELVRGEEDCPR